MVSDAAAASPSAQSHQATGCRSRGGGRSRRRAPLAPAYDGDGAARAEEHDDHDRRRPSPAGRRRPAPTGQRRRAPPTGSISPSTPPGDLVGWPALPGAALDDSPEVGVTLGVATLDAALDEALGVGIALGVAKGMKQHRSL